MTQRTTITVDPMVKYDTDGRPRCCWCPNRAVSFEALLMSTGEGPRNYRCNGHQRTSLAPNTVSGNVTAKDCAPVSGGN